MFEAPPPGGAGAAGGGLRASLNSAIAYDPICNPFCLEVTLEPQAIVLTGSASPEAVRRAKEIIVEIAGSVSIWDRTISLPAKPLPPWL